MKTPHLCLILALLPAAALAQTPLPPDEAVSQAIAAQAEVRAAQARLDASRADARARKVGSGEWSLGASAQQRRSLENGSQRHYPEYELQLGRSLRWPGKRALDMQIGQHGEHAADQRLDDARHMAARRLLEAWLGWLASVELQQLAQAQHASLQREHKALAHRVQLGDAARKDLDLLEVELAQAHAQTLAADAELARRQQALRHDFPKLPLPERAPVIATPSRLPETAAIWVERIISRSHEIGALQAEAEAANALAQRSQADRRLPDPSLGLRLLRERGGQENALGLVFSMPLPGQYRRYQSESAEAQARARHDDTAAMRRDISRSANELLLHAENSYQSWQAQQQALAASHQATGRIHRGWQLGEISLADWLQAERQQRQIARAELDARLAAEHARLGVLVDSHEIWHE